MKRILIIAGGGTKHLAEFIKAGKNLGIEATTASFSDLEYFTDTDTLLTVKDEDIANFDACYIRLVGKHFEKAALLVNYCRGKRIRVFDRVFEREDLIRVPIPKSIEIKLLVKAGIPTPQTYFGNLRRIRQKAPKHFGFPFVIKETTGKQGFAVWSPRNEKELEELYLKLLPKEKKQKKSFIAQEFIESSQRSRIFVVGEKALVGITRPTRWRKRFIRKVNDEFPPGEKRALDPLPKDEADLAVKAASALGIDVAGVDILKDEPTGKLYVIEVNSAPRWEAVKQDTGLDIEKEILIFLTSLLK